eukprot:TRINITY_DN47709_c0_g1_i1.p1 TRINITY_DN47709_c0_g1~~TRINITY_DN47709_c0_g1_i1.p1  ORF type:complete len:472 (-),score=104.19 TRINITY_DN47709_c0_g1_i1:99-1514(-)
MSEKSVPTVESDVTSDNIDPETKNPRVRFFSLIILGFSAFLAGCTLSILAPFYSKEAEDHGISVTASGTVFASVFVLQIIFTPVFGKYIKVIGSTKLFIFGVMTSGLTNILFGFLPAIKSGPVFLGASLAIRSVTALGESAMSTAVYPLARKRCAQGSQSSMMSMLETMIGFGTTIGPFIGGLLFEYGGFCLPFATCGILLLFCGCLACLVLDPREEEKAAAEEEERGPAVAGSFRLLLSTPVMLLACLVTVVTGMSTQWYQPSLEPYVRTQFGMSPFQASLLFIIDGCTYALVTPIIGKLLDKGLDCRVVLVFGSGIICFGYLLLAPAPPFLFAPSLVQIGVGAGVHGVGMAMNFIGTLTLMTQESGRKSADSEQIQGMVTSIWITCESLGGFIGAAAGGAAYDKLGWSSSCVMVAGCQTVAMVLVVSGWLAGIVSLYTNSKVYRKEEYKKLIGSSPEHIHGSYGSTLAV